MNYIYVLAHTMGPYLCADGNMSENSKDAMQFSDKDAASEYLKHSRWYRLLYVQTLIK